MASKRRASADHAAQLGKEKVEIKPLGAGQEVGRSCFVLSYLDKTIMFDCGVHPAHSGHMSLPLFDQADMDQIDMALITHFHLDHCAAVPYLVAHTAFKGRLFMTHATKAIFYTMMKDVVKMNKNKPDRKLFSEDDLDMAMSKIEVINFHQTLDIGGVKITPYRAGHVLGAAMFMVEIKGMRCLYTGDYSRVPDRHMPAADLPSIPPHIVIVESTFGVSKHLPREERERAFQNKVRDIVMRGGRCLLPVVALGRAQELLLILEECWERHPALQNIPIYQTSGIASRSLGVYQSYIEMMNEDIRNAFKLRNPFKLKWVQHVKGFRAENELGPCVVLATPSMLQTGLSRELFEAWCEDSKNGVIIADFAVQGTLAAELLQMPREVLAADGRSLKLRCSVDAISFSAHADYEQTSEFLERLQPPHVVLCHGNFNEMDRLRRALEKQAATHNTPREVHMPAIGHSVQLGFVPRRSVRVVGQLAEQPLQEGSRVQGVLVQRNKHSDASVVAPDDLGQYTKVARAQIVQRQLLQLQSDFDSCRLALEMMFEGIEGDQAMGGVECMDHEGDGHVLKIADMITLTHIPPSEVKYEGMRSSQGRYGQVALQWESKPVADCMADAVVAILLQHQGQPAALGAAEEFRRKAMVDGDINAQQNAELSMVAELIKAQFGGVNVDIKTQTISVEVPGNQVTVEWKSGDIICNPPDPSLHARVATCLQRMRAALSRFEPTKMEAAVDTIL